MIKQSFKRSVSLCILCFTQACSIFGIQNEEQPEFEVVQDSPPYQLRSYSSYLIAETTETGSFDEAQSKAFRRLANYIFGENAAKTEVAMTAPVRQVPAESEKIDMTGMVQQNKTKQGWSMSFMMPSKYTMETLPKPIDKEILIRKVPERHVAVINFSGFFDQKNLEKHEKMLLEWIEANNLTPVKSPEYAGYNPPWTIPWFKTNEVLVEIKKP